MYPILFDETETAFTSNGIGRLIDATHCTVTEELNGQYELEMQYPITGQHYADITEDRYILVRHDDDTMDLQPFQIYKISRPLNGIVTVYAQHISYQLSKMIVMPFTATSCLTALAALSSHIVGTNPFTFSTDIITAADFELTEPKSVRAVLGDILEVYGGEFEWDGFSVTLHSQRGQATGTTIRYGKNLSALEKVSDISNEWTGIVPYWKSGDGGTCVTLPEQVIWGTQPAAFGRKMAIAVNFSDKFKSRPTVSQLRSAATAYVSENCSTGVPESVEFSFVPLWQTEEYKDIAILQRLAIGDLTTVQYEELGVSATAEIVSVQYDVLAERYDTMTIGKIQANLASTISQAVQEIKDEVPTLSVMNQAITEATDLITGGLGGNIVLNKNADGKPFEFLILDDDEISTALNLWRFNIAGLGHSSNGYNGPYDTAITMDGKINANFITTGTLSADLITAGHMSADRIQGGTLTLGGANNVDGVLEIYNAQNRLCGSWDKDGITLLSGTIGGWTIYPSAISSDAGSGVTAVGVQLTAPAAASDKILQSTIAGHTAMYIAANGEAWITEMASPCTFDKNVEFDGGVMLAAGTNNQFTCYQPSTFYGDVAFYENASATTAESVSFYIPTVFDENASFNSSLFAGGGAEVTGTLSLWPQGSYGQNGTEIYIRSGILYVGWTRQNSTSFVPAANSSMTLGSQWTAWSKLYTDDAQINNDLDVDGDATIDGALTVTGNIGTSGAIWLGSNSIASNGNTLYMNTVYASTGSFSPSNGGIDLGTQSSPWNMVYSLNGYTQTSDERSKHDIAYLDGKAVDLIMGVTPVSFRYNEDPAQEHYGLIAQDVKMVMDRLKIAKDAFGGYVDGETLGLRYDEFIAPLILTVQRQQEEIDELKRLIKEGK